MDHARSRLTGKRRIWASGSRNIVRIWCLFGLVFEERGERALKTGRITAASLYRGLFGLTIVEVVEIDHLQTPFVARRTERRGREVGTRRIRRPWCRRHALWSLRSLGLRGRLSRELLVILPIPLSPFVHRKSPSRRLVQVLSASRRFPPLNFVPRQRLQTFRRPRLLGLGEEIRNLLPQYVAGGPYDERGALELVSKSTGSMRVRTWIR